MICRIKNEEYGSWYPNEFHAQYIYYNYWLIDAIMEPEGIYSEIKFYCYLDHTNYIKNNSDTYNFSFDARIK